MADHKSNGRERLQSAFRKGVREGRRIERAECSAGVINEAALIAALAAAEEEDALFNIVSDDEERVSVARVLIQTYLAATHGSKTKSIGTGGSE